MAFRLLTLLLRVTRRSIINALSVYTNYCCGWIYTKIVVNFLGIQFTIFFQTPIPKNSRFDFIQNVSQFSDPTIGCSCLLYVELSYMLFKFFFLACNE